MRYPQTRLQVRTSNGSAESRVEGVRGRPRKPQIRGVDFDVTSNVVHEDAAETGPPSVADVTIGGRSRRKLQR